MEDFILNEIMDSQEDTPMLIADDENVDSVEDLVSADTEDNCPNTEEYNNDPYPNQEPYYDLFQEDRNGDGIVDAVHVMEDTDGDGIIDHMISYVDDNFDNERNHKI